MGHVHGAAAVAASNGTALPEPSSGGPYFTTNFQGLFFLFEKFQLVTLSHLIIACVVTAFACWIERLLTFFLDRAFYTGCDGDTWTWMKRSGLYILAVFLRYGLMLVAMSFNLALFLTVVLGLASAQLLVEYLNLREARLKATTIGFNGKDSYHGSHDSC